MYLQCLNKFQILKILSDYESEALMISWSSMHYENISIQIYWKFHHQKLKVFRQKF